MAHSKTRVMTLTEKYILRYAKPRGLNLACPICGRVPRPGDRVVRKVCGGSPLKFYCENHFYAEIGNMLTHVNPQLHMMVLNNGQA